MSEMNGTKNRLDIEDERLVNLQAQQQKRDKMNHMEKKRLKK